MFLYITSVVNMMWFWFYINVNVVRSLLMEIEERTEVMGRQGKRSKQLLIILRKREDTGI